MEILEMEQGTQEWLDARLGCLTASNASDLMSEPKSAADKAAGLLSDGAITYVLKIAAEAITGVRSEDDVTNRYTEWGHTWQPKATEYYERIMKVHVQQVGFIKSAPHIGGSPDGLVGSDGGVEFKCPYNIHEHLRNLEITTPEQLKKVHKDHYWQCIQCMLIANRKWWDFVSFHPSFPAASRFHRVRIPRSAIEVGALRKKLDKGVEYIEELVSKHKETQKLPWE